MTALRSAAVFDLGGVLIDWNPRYLYRKLFQHEADMEYFLANICTPEWNLQQDAGRSFAEACATLKREKPGYTEMIDAWFGRYDEMMAGPIAGSVDLLAQLRTDLQIRSHTGEPIRSFSDWEKYALPPERRKRHWKKGRSAFELGWSWTASGQPAAPAELVQLISSHEATRGTVILSGITEHETTLPFGERGARCHDLALRAEQDGHLVTICGGSGRGAEGCASSCPFVRSAAEAGEYIERRLRCEGERS